IKWNTKRIEEIIPKFSLEIQCLKPRQMGAKYIYI
ncbi:unnamed protein product, partial [Brassica rapa]